MGGKDSPTNTIYCVPSSPVHPAKSVGSRTQRSQTVVARKSPIEYMPRNKATVNVDLKLPYGEPSKAQTLPRERPAQKAPAPISPRGDGSYSPIKAYMECFQPQTLKCVLVGDSGVGKTSMLMAYTVDKFPDTHAPTIFDRFSSKNLIYNYIAR